jgi:hypothetical protein
MLFPILNLPAQLNPSTASDSIKISAKAARNLLIKAQQAAILEDEVKNLNERIIEKERQLAITSTRDSLLMISLNSDISNLKEQKKVFSDALDTMTKELRKQKRKTRWTAIAGIVATIGGIFFIK